MTTDSDSVVSDGICITLGISPAEMKIFLSLFISAHYINNSRRHFFKIRNISNIYIYTYIYIYIYIYIYLKRRMNFFSNNATHRELKGFGEKSYQTLL